MKYHKEVHNNPGVLRISGNPQESMLFLNSAPIQYSWLAEIGSTWRYHIAKSITQEDISVNTKADKILNKGISNRQEFYAIVDYYSELLDKGMYEFGLYEIPFDTHITSIPKENVYVSFDYYGGLLDFSSTQSKINAKIIECYKKEISRGSCPTMVVLHVKNSHLFFILDGHHKFIAYNRLNKMPNVFIITLLKNEYKSIAYTTALAKQMSCTNESYFKWMLSEKTHVQRYKNKRLRLGKTFLEVYLS